MLLYIIIQLEIILPIISGTVPPQVSFKSKHFSIKCNRDYRKIYSYFIVFKNLYIL